MCYVGIWINAVIRTRLGVIFFLSDILRCSLNRRFSCERHVVSVGGHAHCCMCKYSVTATLLRTHTIKTPRENCLRNSALLFPVSPREHAVKT